ncbi:pseudouridine-5'-phosphate glycosidase [Alicyclobacillus curvatus]|nr:pseudouridine-5'-phosphate glycosidase [Alicyclobacillus curvatus]
MTQNTNAVIRELLQPSEEVADAINEGRPVVALETTIVTHGMPYPVNVETALSVERIIRQAGAVPATISIGNGKIRVGLSSDEIEALAHEQDVVKASRRDLPVLLAMKKSGSTTVAATMIAAELAGIRVFVTGGIGGVHRGAERTMDVSADLQELARTDVIVVSAGAKAILDIGLTLEVLETYGVPVLGYQTDVFPAFYTRDSGFPANFRVDTAQAVADIARVKWGLGLHGGMLVGNPIPLDAELDSQEIQRAIETALAHADEQGITGKDVTPFLLSQMEFLTVGKSLVANVRLIEHNALVGAQIANAVAERRD